MLSTPEKSPFCKSLGREPRDLGVVQMDARSVPLGGGAVPDVVFIDPPYEIVAEVFTPEMLEERERGSATGRTRRYPTSRPREGRRG